MKRRILLWLLFIAFIWIIITRMVEIEILLDTVIHAHLGWLAAAILFEIAYLVINAAIYQTAFRTVDLNSPLLRLVPLSLASIFVNVIAPAGGAAGVALFADDAARRGQSGVKAAAGYFLQVLVDYLAVLLVLGIGLAYLYEENRLQFYQIGGTLVFLLLTLVILTVLLLGRWQPVLLNRLLTTFHRLVNSAARKIRRPAPLADTWADKTARELSTAAVAITHNPGRLARALLYALLRHTAGILSLFAVFKAFRYEIGLGPLVAGYAVGLLFLIVSITPQGVGILEGIYVLLFRSLGVPGAVATAVGLTYRGLTFWFPFLAGFILLRLIPSFKARGAQPSEPAAVRVEPDCVREANIEEPEVEKPA